MHAEVKSFLSRLSNNPTKVLPFDPPVWIFGAGPFGRDLAKSLIKHGYSVAGFIETVPKTSQILDLPVITWSQWDKVHKTAPLCIGIFNRSTPLDQLQSLAVLEGAQSVFLPWDLYPIVQAEMGWRFWLDDAQLIYRNVDAFAEAYECLEDEASKSCFLDTAAFRMGLKTDYGSFHHSDNQYFNSLTLDALKGAPIRYVDAGAFNGDTYLELCSLASVGSAYLFEPDSANYTQLVKNTSRTGGHALCLPMGLSSTYGILSFNAGQGEGASISSDGKSHIAVASLDELLQCQDVDFIKMDVEGAELQVLNGARRLIERSRPVLALSLYHCPKDLWELPLVLKSMCDGYRFYIRQHYFNTFESVLYALPSYR